MRTCFFFILYLFSLVDLQAEPSRPFWTEPVLKTEIFPFSCNLPAPQNLVTTGITSSSLSFAWNTVAGSSGYDVELIETNSNITVYTASTFTNSVNISGLNFSTTYTVKIWGICAFRAYKKFKNSVMCF